VTENNGYLSAVSSTMSSYLLHILWLPFSLSNVVTKFMWCLLLCLRIKGVKYTRAYFFYFITNNVRASIAQCCECDDDTVCTTFTLNHRDVVTIKINKMKYFLAEWRFHCSTLLRNVLFCPTVLCVVMSLTHTKKVTHGASYCGSGSMLFSSHLQFNGYIAAFSMQHL
jgi:hypothetical protein